jgi:hypothetical protein
MWLPLFAKAHPPDLVSHVLVAFGVGRPFATWMWTGSPFSAV